MITSRMMAGAGTADAELVAQSMDGNRDAFGRIVSRYQSLICSLAYSATGSLGQSEDLAQETFISAWRHLGHLRERHKLRSWLCGIARNRINNTLRREHHEPLCGAEPLDNAPEAPTAEPLPRDQAISKEEETILWRSLERIPEIYREPLILFYREGDSVEHVAAALELSEDAVRQRLSRGRKLLHEEVLGFVEGALARTNPGKAFTLGVLAALPVFATSASAATIAAAAAKGSAAATLATLVTVFNSLLGPVLGVLGAYFGVRASLDATRTPRERQYVVRQTKIGIAVAVAFNLVLGVYIFAAVNSWASHPVFFAALGLSIPLLFTGCILVRAFHCNRRFRRMREEERQNRPDLFQDETSVTTGIFREYRSRWTLLGLPLVHVRTGARLGEKTQPAVGWIAIGDRAFGIVFAGGGVAVGAISMGGAAAGLIAMGGACVGLVAIGGFALGGLALGGGAIGMVAAGGVATAWTGAEGGLAVAREFAVGARALAHHANDAAAREFFAHYRWMDMTRAGTRGWFMTLCWLPMVLVLWQARRVRRSRQLRDESCENSL